MQRLFIHWYTSPILILVSVLLAASLLTGCSPRKLPAFGSANEIKVVTNLGIEDEAVALLRSLFARPLITEDEDTLYTLEILSASEFTKYSRRYDASRNLVLLVDITRRDGLTKKIEGLLGTNVMKRIQEGPAEYFVRSDVWALAQTLTIIAGAGKQSLAQVMASRGDRLYAEVDSLVIERTREAIYAGGEQSSIARDLISKYGWSLNLPLGFEAMELDTVETGLLLRLRKNEPMRHVFVFWMPFEASESLDPKKCLELRGKLVWTVYDQDVMDYTRTITENTVFEGREAVRIDGIWQNEKSGMRGPFFTYCFRTKNRFYMIDAVIYAPGTRKGALFRQFEVMMTTFRVLT